MRLTSPEARREPSFENARAKTSPRLSEISARTFKDVPVTLASVTFWPVPKATRSSLEPPYAATAVVAPAWTDDEPPTGWISNPSEVGTYTAAIVEARPAGCAFVGIDLEL